MPFRIKQSHKFTEQFPKGGKSSKKDVLSEDYKLLYDLGNNQSKMKPKKRTGGNYIRSVNSAQADFY
jgi:hypothetical protein